MISKFFDNFTLSSFQKFALYIRRSRKGHYHSPFCLSNRTRKPHLTNTDVSRIMHENPMRKWLYFLLIIAIAYMVSQAGKKTEDRSSFLKKISEAIGIIVWILIIVYTVGFLYWLYTEVFMK